MGFITITTISVLIIYFYTNSKLSMSTLLEVNKVVKQYGDYVALNVSLTLYLRSIYGLLGPNGAGKTSLIRIINQITLPDSGEIILDGEKLQPRHVQYIGYLPEEEVCIIV
jgi:ABC-2 type transport system ATP-binding protein